MSHHCQTLDQRSTNGALNLATGRCADNFDAKIFHLHIPKAAGCSLVSDLSSMVGRKNIYSCDLAICGVVVSHGIPG